MCLLTEKHITIKWFYNNKKVELESNQASALNYHFRENIRNPLKYAKGIQLAKTSLYETLQEKPSFFIEYKEKKRIGGGAYRKQSTLRDLSTNNNVDPDFKKSLKITFLRKLDIINIKQLMLTM